MRQWNWPKAVVSGFVVLSLMASPLAFGQDGDEDVADSEEATGVPATRGNAGAGVAANDSGAAVNNSGGGLLGALRVGPTVSVGFPFLMNYGVDATWDKTFGFGVGGGRFKRDIDATTQVELFNFDLRARWFPWQGSFFLGAAYGNQGIVGRVEKDLDVTTGNLTTKVPTTARLELDNKYITPHLGWFATWDVGFTLGFEIGMQIPMSSKAELQTAFKNVSAATEEMLKDTDDYKKMKKDVEDMAASYGEKAVPYVNLLRLGWLF